MRSEIMFTLTSCFVTSEYICDYTGMELVGHQPSRGALFVCVCMCVSVYPCVRGHYPILLGA